jgi:predicted RND superfamily exporter protein
MTTIVAFGSLWMASNPGLVSLAQVAILSMGSTLVVNLVWLPPCLWFLKRRAKPKTA